jgi:hypothetical protein
MQHQYVHGWGFLFSGNRHSAMQAGMWPGVAGSTTARVEMLGTSIVAVPCSYSCSTVDRPVRLPCFIAWCPEERD